MHRFRVAVLRILDEKHHQECNDSRASIDDELPRIRKMKGRTGQSPYGNDKNGRDKRPGTAQNL